MVAMGFQETFEVGLGFAGRRVKPAVSPCFRAFWEDLALPSGVVGPWDLAPLARAVSDFDWPSCRGNSMAGRRGWAGGSGKW